MAAAFYYAKKRTLSLISLGIMLHCKKEWGFVLMKLDMVGIVVNDIKAAQLFYKRLGFEVQGEGMADYLELENEGVRISLNTAKMIEGIYGFPPTANGEKIELAFLCGTPADVDAQCQKMAEYGYEIFREPWDAFWGQRYAIIKDVDQNLISLFANVPS
jgi:catechol 2,3-dioxygenase-like lactoylglutathione lyase family enzyme